MSFVNPTPDSELDAENTARAAQRSAEKAQTTDLVTITGELSEIGRHGSDNTTLTIIVNGSRVFRLFGLSDQQARSLAPELYSMVTLEIRRHG